MTTGQSKKSTAGVSKNVLGKDRRQSPSEVLRQFAASLDLESDEDPSVERVRQLSSSYGTALEWMHTHNSDIIVALRLLRIYPKLIQTDIANPLLKLLKPLQNPSQRPVEIEEETSESLPSARKVVYVCGHSEYVGEGVTAKDRIIASLSCYCRVQTHPDPPPQEDSAQDALEEVKASDVFIFLLNDDTLNCWFSLYRLSGAVNFNIPIITIKDSTFELPDPLPESFYQTEILTDHNLGLRLDVANGLAPGENRLSSSRSSGFHSACSQTKYSESSEQIHSDCCLLADVIKTCHLSSMKYVSKFHNSCVAKLFGKLSDYLGDFFLDLEISNHFGRFTPDAEAAENGKTSVYFSKSAILRKRPSPPFQRRSDLTIVVGGEHMLSTTPYLGKAHSANGVYKMEKDLSRDSRFADNDCESPFVHKTNYVVFPSRSPSSARKSPYVVAFPEGIDNVEKEGSDHTVSPYGDFDNVRLDITAPFKDSPPSSPTSTGKTNRDEAEDGKETSNKREEDSKVAREPSKFQRREPKECTPARDGTTVVASTNKKTVGRRTAKLPKINLQVHDVRAMKKHNKSRKLGKSVSI